jgi:hypothetical protein
MENTEEHDADRSNHKVTQGLPHEGEVHEYQPDPQSTLEYLRSIAPQRKRNRTKRVVITLVTLVMLAGLAGGAYWLFFRSKPTPKPAQQNANTQQSSESSTTKSTKHYSSSTFGLEFDYPEDWTAAETAGSGTLTVRSPATQLKSATGQKVTGQVLLTFRNKQQTLTEFNEGNAVAARESVKLTYAKPSSTQRGSTYVSFLRYARTSNGQALDGVYVTGDNGYQTGQAIPKADFTPVDPIISVTFTKCADRECTRDGTPLSIQSSSWSDHALSKPVLAMLTSLVVM